MKRILFATSYSPHSKSAFRYAQRLALFFGAEITLVHIYQIASPILATNSSMSASFANQKTATENWKHELHKLEAFAEDLTTDEYENLKLNFIATDGDVVEELIKIQHENQFQLTILGMTNRSLKTRIFGSIAHDIIDELNSAILLVPPDAYYMGLDQIIYGTAFKFAEEKSIDYLLKWCKAFDSTLHILHVHKKDEKEDAEYKMNLLKVYYSEHHKDSKISFQLLEGKIADSLEAYVEFTNADILAVHPRKQGFWQRISEGSITHLLSEEVKVPLLVLKA